jgi:transposase
MRKRMDVGLKAKVALEAFRGEKTLAELSAEYGVHANQISRWKQELIKRSGELFSKANRLRTDNHQELVDKLHRAIGELKVENDWLKKKLNLLG